MQSDWEDALTELVGLLRADLYLALVDDRTVTWKALAERSGVHVTTIRPFVHDAVDNNPTLGTLTALARAIYEVA